MATSNEVTWFRPKEVVLSPKFRRGLLARFLFTAHATLCVYQVAFFVNDPNLWFVMFLLFAMYVEFIYVAIFRKGKEWKWFFACILCYLMVVIPVLWTLELDVLESRLKLRTDDDDDCGLLDATEINKTNTIDFIGVLGLDGTDENWSLILQQLLIFVLIIGRWVLPRGSMSGDQHSQLLLVYIGSGADILEFAAEGLRLDEIQCDTVIIYAILILWTISLFQFTLPLTTTARTPTGMPSNCLAAAIKRCVAKCCGTEIWAILVTVLMQDGPFLGIRLYLLLYKQVINELLLFFACKNILTIILQGNRLYALYTHRRERRRMSRRIPFRARPSEDARGDDDENQEPINLGGVENGKPESEIVENGKPQLENASCAENGNALSVENVAGTENGSAVSNKNIRGAENGSAVTDNGGGVVNVTYESENEETTENVPSYRTSE